MAAIPSNLGTLEMALKAATLRHEVIANNIANVNVPGFQGQDVTFEEQLKQAMNQAPPRSGLIGLTTDPRHIPIPAASSAPPLAPEPRVVPLDQPMRQDGNNVDVEEQMARLAANQLWYQALVRSISDELNRLRTAATDGRR